VNVKLEYASFQDFANRLWPCLSEEGMWVPSERTAGVGELVDFDVMLADGFRLFHGTGQVIGVGPGPAGSPAGSGMTIRFSQLDSSSQNLIQKVVSKHKAEGGGPFVLSAPATKVEVVGEDASGSMGPEDLVAPFPDLETEADWADGAEPELTSFLRPSGGSTDLDLEPDSGGLPNLDFRADPSPPAEAPAADEANAPELEAPAVEEPAAEMMPEPEEVAAEEAPSTLVPEPGPLALDEDGDAEREPEPAAATPPGSAEEPEQRTFSQLQDEFEGEVARTQVVEPGVLEEHAPGAGGAGSASPFPVPGVEPMPSTAVPPSVELYDSGDFDDDEFLDEAPTGTHLAKWLWALVGVVAIVAGFFLVQRFYGRDTGGDSISTEPTAGAETSVVAGAGDATGGSDPLAAAQNDVDGSSADAADAGSEVLDGSVDGAPTAGGAADGSSTDPVPADASMDDGTRSDGVGVAPPAADSGGVAGAATPTPAPTGAPSAADEPSAQAVAPRSAEGELLRLQRITWSERDGDTVIRLWLDGAAPQDRLSTVRVAEGAPRLVLKIAGIAGAVPRTPTTIGSEHVERLRYGVHPAAGGSELHVVADLTDAAVELIGSLAVDDGGVELRLGRPAS
jgi:hypothetical protein